jgi:hypothetical protein
MGPVTKIISLLKGKAHLENEVSLDTINNLMDEYDIDFKGSKDKLYSIINTVWAQSIQTTNMCDFDDQLFMPLYYDLPVTQFDMVHVDESQDLNPSQMELITKASNRIFIVGDKYQAIYGFRACINLLSYGILLMITIRLRLWEYAALCIIAIGLMFYLLIFKSKVVDDDN